jgi:hypothetical protein
MYTIGFTHDSILQHNTLKKISYHKKNTEIIQHFFLKYLLNSTIFQTGGCY